MVALTSHAPQFRVLPDTKIEWIYETALACLQRTGVKVLNVEAKALLASAGAQVDGDRVRLPAFIIQEAVTRAPREFTLWGRTGEFALQLSRDGNYFGPGPTSTYFIDPETGKRRRTRRGDPGLTARVCDALEHIDYVMSLGLIGDVTPELAPVYEFAEMIANSRKPVMAWAWGVDQAIDIYQIAVAVAGSETALRERPFMAFFSTSQAPLIHTQYDLANQLWMVAHGIPVVYMGGGTVGSTSPITGAGALVVALAEMLSGLAILQLKKPGAPVCLGSVTAPVDLRTARPAFGGPEMSLYCAAMSEILHYLDLPYMGTGGASEAKYLDPQAGIESTIQVLLSGLSRATLVHDVGFLDCADIGSIETLIMNNEIIGMIRRILRGIEVGNQDELLDLIDRVGPDGHFLSTMHTAKLCRQEIWVPDLMDRKTWAEWEASGSQSFRSRVQAKLTNILATHIVPPLPEETNIAIENILQRAEERMGGRN
jgi:trimethylamine--corrinoid protein Co-methyltransferase